MARWATPAAFLLAVYLSETFRAWVLLFMLLVGFAGFVRFLSQGPLKWLAAGLMLGSLFGCGSRE
jgi:hypothetical protein